MMPLSPALTSVGSITGPLISEFESYLAGMPLIFLVQVLLCGFFMLTVTIFYAKLRPLDDGSALFPAVETARKGTINN